MELLPTWALTVCITTLVICIRLVSATLQHDTLLSEANNQYGALKEMYEALHQVAELQFEEYLTSSYVRKKLTEFNISYTDGWSIPSHTNALGGTGIVAEIGNGKPPCVALRADIDALPIEEKVDVPFKSLFPDTMHACGHDAHTAMLLGAAFLLKQHEAKLNGTIRLIFQPAEEGGAGAKYMVDEGVMQNYPAVQRIFGLHVDPTMPTGRLSGREGVIMAAVDIFTMKVKGSGGHAAIPFSSIDPIAAMAAIVGGLYDIYARELYFQMNTSGVISITSVSGGTSDCIIPPEVTIQGTLRSLSMEGLQRLKKRVTEVAEGIAAAYRCTVEISSSMPSYPPTLNSAALHKFYEKIVAAVSEEGALYERPIRMGGEDFSFYSQEGDAYFAFIGIGSGGMLEGHPLTNVSNHNPYFAVDQRVLPIGAALHAYIGVESLREMLPINEKAV